MVIQVVICHYKNLIELKPKLIREMTWGKIKKSLEEIKEDLN
jgi:hypothetical protein